MTLTEANNKLYDIREVLRTIRQDNIKALEFYNKDSNIMYCGISESYGKHEPKKPDTIITNKNITMLKIYGYIPYLYTDKYLYSEEAIIERKLVRRLFKYALDKYLRQEFYLVCDFGNLVEKDYEWWYVPVKAFLEV